jgi:hypothetical protein
MATPPEQSPRIRPVLLVPLGILAFAVGAAVVWLVVRHGTSRSASSPSPGRTPSASEPAQKATPPATVAGAALTWSRATDPSLGGPGDQRINAIAEGGGKGPKLVAGGSSAHDGAVWITNDGARWEKSQVGLGGPGDQVINSVAGGKGWTAVGRDTSTGNSDAAVWTSSDARTWQRVNDPALGGPGDQVIYRETGTKFGLIAAGSDSRNGDADAAIWIRQSGGPWREISGGTLGGGGNQIAYRVRDIGNKLVAVGTDDAGGDQDAAVWVSADALHWFRVADRTGQLGGKGDQVLLDVVQLGTGMVGGGFTTGVQGKDGALWRSADGVTWSRVTGQSDLDGPGDQVITRLTPNIPGFKLGAFGQDTSLGTTDAAVWLSVDGSTVRREVILGGSRDQSIQSVAVSGGLVVLVGSDSFNGNLDAAVWTAKLGE